MFTLNPKMARCSTQRSLADWCPTVQYLLGYLHGRPDAYLTEMQRILKEAFNHDVSLPTISRTLKLKGCMKGFNKTRKIRTALDITAQEQSNGSLGNEIIGRPVPTSSNAETSKNGTLPLDFEKNLERQLEDHLQQPSPNKVIPGKVHLRDDQDVTIDQRGHVDDSRSGMQYQEQQATSGTTVPVHFAQARSDQAIDPNLG